MEMKSLKFKKYELSSLLLCLRINLDISDYSRFSSKQYTIVHTITLARLQNLDKRWEEVLTFLPNICSFLRVIEQKCRYTKVLTYYLVDMKLASSFILSQLST